MTPKRIREFAKEGLYPQSAMSGGTLQADEAEDDTDNERCSLCHVWIVLDNGTEWPDDRSTMLCNHCAQEEVYRLRAALAAAERRGMEPILRALRTALGTMQGPMAEMEKRCVLDRPHDHGHLRALRSAMRILQAAHDAALAAEPEKKP